ncbi:hypothetical protein [Shewanella nanhaiensis]|uniref:Uncharacterized protein n=1 Tax=Shewanella nanhaiensis TaxID=2864872 RepID=A0ABS7E577_9GAMM|nr:hypothetical protein [Shewanella nanhaiensis]MBW8184839.1 hypothetical protein [Shewanella nanhaiensis]
MKSGLDSVDEPHLQPFVAKRQDLTEDDLLHDGRLVGASSEEELPSGTSFSASDTSARDTEVGQLQASQLTPRHRQPTLVLLFVFIGHFVLIGMLHHVWQPQRLALPEHKAPKLSSYIYYEPKVEPKVIKEMVEPIKNIVKEEVSVSPEPEDKPLVQVSDFPQTREDKEEVSVKAQESLKLDVIASKEADSSHDKVRVKSEGSLSQSTRNYFQRQREQALDELVISQSDRYTRKRSLSEMDGDMIILSLPEHNVWEETKTLDSNLDPNRIVKQGSTCYRIVKTPNPLNPHAENLGYPFRCDGKSLVSDLQKAIAKRAEKMGIKR